MESEKYPIKYSLSNLQNLFRETCECIHSATINSREEKPYSPTYFMYMFCFFNTLYNVNWKESVESGFQTLYTDNEYDSSKIRSLVDFCFSDDEFWPRYVNRFVSTLLQKRNQDDIKEALKDIKRDKSPNGNFYADKKEEINSIKRFQKDVKELIYNRNFDKYRIQKTIDFIYKVRCNIFHGIKCLHELGEYAQRDRMEIYANILRAVNEMTLEYANNVIRNKD